MDEWNKIDEGVKRHVLKSTIAHLWFCISGFVCYLQKYLFNKSSIQLKERDVLVAICAVLGHFCQVSLQ